MVEAIKKPTHMTEEEKYKQDLIDAGVEMPELDKKTEGETPEQTKAKEKEAEDAKIKADEDAAKAAEDKGTDEGEDKKTPPPTEKKRSIYDDLKDKKKEVRAAEERALKAEKERDELKAIVDKSTKADTKEEKKEALDKFDAFAEKIGADPAAIKEMRDLFLEGIKPDEETQKGLLEFKEWKKGQAEVDAKTQFENEFTQTLPALKTLFPKANDEAMAAIKTELDKLSHTAGWNTQPLDYIAFKHQDSLSKLVSPKKRGLENTDRVDETVETASTFDPNADYASMSAAERTAWEKDYNKATKTPEGITVSPTGKKILI